MITQLNIVSNDLLVKYNINEDTSRSHLFVFYIVSSLILVHPGGCSSKYIISSLPSSAGVTAIGFKRVGTAIRIYLFFIFLIYL